MADNGKRRRRGHNGPKESDSCSTQYREERGAEQQQHPVDDAGKPIRLQIPARPVTRRPNSCERGGCVIGGDDPRSGHHDTSTNQTTLKNKVALRPPTVKTFAAFQDEQPANRATCVIRTRRARRRLNRDRPLASGSGEGERPRIQAASIPARWPASVRPVRGRASGRGPQRTHLRRRFGHLRGAGVRLLRLHYRDPPVPLSAVAARDQTITVRRARRGIAPRGGAGVRRGTRRNDWLRTQPPVAIAGSTEGTRKRVSCRGEPQTCTSPKGGASASAAERPPWTKLATPCVRSGGFRSAQHEQAISRGEAPLRRPETAWSLVPGASDRIVDESANGGRDAERTQSYQPGRRRRRGAGTRLRGQVGGTWGARRPRRRADRLDSLPSSPREALAVHASPQTGGGGLRDPRRDGPDQAG